MALEADPNEPPESAPERGSLAGATVKQLGVGALRGLVAPVAEAGKWLTNGEEGGVEDRTAQIARGIATAIEGTIPADRRKDVDASFFPGPNERSVFENPVSSVVQKTARMAPMFALAAVPGVAGQAAVGGVLGGGGHATEIKTSIENATDEELAAAHPSFATSLQIGMPSDYARKILQDELLTPESAALATAGGAAGGAIMGRALNPGTTGLRAIGKGAAEGAVGMGVQAGVTDVAVQEGEINAGELAGLDVARALKASLNPIAEGGIIGGAFGAIGAMRNRPARPSKEVEQKTSGPTQEQREALAPEQPAVEPSETPVTPGGKPLTLDERIVAAEAKEAPVVAPEAPATPATPATPVAPVAVQPSVPAPIPQRNFSGVRDAVHILTGVNTPLGKLLPKLNAHLSDLGEPAITPGELLPVLQKMKADGEMTNKGKGWRTTRLKPPPIPEVVPETSSPEVATPAARPAVVPTGNEGRAGEPVLKIAPRVESVTMEPDPTPVTPKIEPPKVEAPAKGRSLKEELASLVGKTDPESVARRETLEARFKSAQQRADLLGKPKTPEQIAVERAKADAKAAEVGAESVVAPVAEAATKPNTLEPDPTPVTPEVKAEVKAEVKVEAPKKPPKSQAERKEEKIQKLMAEGTETEEAFAARLATHKAETQARREEARAAGKPFVFKAAPERVTAGRTRAEAEALANESEAVAKQRQRHKANKANDKLAEDVVRDTYQAEDGKPLTRELETDEKAARALEPGAIQKMVDRAEAIVKKAIEKGVTFQRAPSSKIEPDTKNLTPWASYVADARRFIDNVKRVRAMHKGSAEKQSELSRVIDDHIYQEEMLRQGKWEDAATRRRANNDELTQQHKKSAGTETTDMLAAELPARVTDVEGNPVERPAGTEAPPQGAGLNSDGLHTAEGNHMPEGFWDAVNAAPVRDAADLMRALPKPSNGESYLIHQRLKAIAEKLAKITGAVRLVVIPDAAVAGDHAFGGIHFNPTSEKFGQGHNGLIVVRQSDANYYVVMHEYVHAATGRLIHTDPSFAVKIEGLRKDTEAWLKEKGDVANNAIGEYALTNEHEFIAEALANPDLQEILRQIPVSKQDAGFWRNIQNKWDQFVATVARSLGMNRSEMNVLDAAMRAGVEAAEQQATSRGNVRPNDLPSHPLTREAAKAYWEERKPSMSEWKTRTNKIANKFMGLTQLGNTSDHMYGENKPARSLVEAIGRMHTETENVRLNDRKLVSDVFAGSRKYAGEVWDKFENFLIDETSAGVFADRDLAGQTHLGKNNPEGWFGKERYVDLNDTWSKMVKATPELGAMRERVHNFFRERQNEMSLQLIKNQLRVLDPAGKGSDALAQRIFEGKLTDADKSVLGEGGLKSVRKAGALSKIAGPYVPLMRHGDFIVSARHEIATPAGARRMDADEKANPTGRVFEFAGKDAEAQARDFVKGLSARPEDVVKVYVEPETGSRWGINEDGSRQRMTAKEPAAEARYRVTVNDKHVEFFERQKHAKSRREELIKLGLKDVADVDLRRLNAGDVGADFMPQQFVKLMNDAQKSDAFKKLAPEGQQAYLEQLREAGIASMATTRAQTRTLPRRAVAGASEDITRGLQTYSSSTASYLSRLKHQPKVDAILAGMKQYVDKNPYAGNGDDTQVLRRQRLQEFERRVYANGDYEPTTVFGKVASRLLQMSYLDKLASPAFHIINSSEPWTVSMPTIAGRHGLIGTVRALHEAYSLVGGGRVALTGIKETGKAFRHDEGLTDYATTIADRVRAKDPEAAKMLDHLREVGLISRNAGMELARMTNPDANIIGRGLDRADLMARQMGTAIENINRAVTALAAYKLEKGKGKSHEEAQQYATETTHDTMGDYNGWNAPPIFNHPVGRLALQFRKYAQKTYYLLGKQAIRSLKGDPEAMKSFAGLMATHMLVAGALGLPLEPIKLGMLAAGLAGVTDKKYGDLEQSARSGATSIFGKQAGEIFTRGLPRFLGVDVANRMGLDTLLTSGMDPKSMKPDDLYAYLAKTFAGAPAAYIVDAVQGFQAAGKGDVLEASRLLVPLKLYADSVQGYQMATEGKKTSKGKQVMEPIGVGQAIIKGMGFQPGSVAEQQEQAFATRGDITALTQQRTNLISQWVNASPGDKATYWKDITNWNKGKPPEAHIKPAQMTAAMQRHKSEERSADYSKGIKYTRQTRHLRSDNDVYNTP